MRATVVVIIIATILVVTGGSTVALAADDDLHPPSYTYPDVVRLWHDGRLADALALLDLQLAPPSDDQPLEALVLRAAVLGDSGQPEAAESLWTEVIGREVWMRTFSRRALVESLAARGEPERAEHVLDELTQSDAARHRDLTLRVAEAYQQDGDTVGASRLYHQVLASQRRGVSADAARLRLAATLETGGDPEAALALLSEAKLLHWTGDTFQVAQRRERQLSSALGRAPRQFGESEYRTVVRRLRNASRHEAALALVEEWRTAHVSTTRPDTIEAERVATLYSQRANKVAVAVIRQFYARFPTSARMPEVRLTDFRLAVRMSDTDRARQTGLDLWEGRVAGATAQQRRSAAELLAAHLVAVGDSAGGLALYRELFRTSQSADGQRAYLWRAGIVALRDGQNRRAVTNFRGLMSRDPSGDLAPAGLYWLGVAEARTDTDAAVRILRTVAERFPYHYYGMRASERLLRLTNGRETGRTHTTLEFPSLAVAQVSRNRAEYKAAMLLARAGLTGDAARYLRRLLDDRRRDRGLALLTSRAAAQAGQYASASRILVNHFGTFLQRPTHRVPADFWQLAYPRPFWDEVDAAARSSGVDPVLLLSLMRQESRFDPAARSPVGAIGLFQIMPYTAEALAESAGVTELITGGIDEVMLMEPAVNSAIAARLTGNLLEMFGGAMAPVIASYNAGEERVALWWTAADGLTEDFFVDTIPYSGNSPLRPRGAHQLRCVPAGVRGSVAQRGAPSRTSIGCALQHVVVSVVEDRLGHTLKRSLGQRVTASFEEGDRVW